jgi:hypothetical protein
MYDVCMNLTSFFVKVQAKFTAWTLCKSMHVLFLAAQEKHPDKKYYSDYAKEALRQKSKWNQVSSDTFQFDNGQQIVVHQGDNLENVVTKMARVEFDDYIDAATPEKSKILDAAISTVHKYFNK